MRDYSLNDIAYNPEPVTLLRRGEGVDPNFDEEAAIERSRRLREEDERFLRGFEQRTKDLVAN